jgi:hypothetical protein
MCVLMLVTIIKIIKIKIMIDINVIIFIIIPRKTVRKAASEIALGSAKNISLLLTMRSAFRDSGAAPRLPSSILHTNTEPQYATLE